MDFEEYHQLEKCGNPVQIDIPVKISEVFEVPLDWLFCKVPMVPIPREKEKS